MRIQLQNQFRLFQMYQFAIDRSLKRENFVCQLTIYKLPGLDNGKQWPVQTILGDIMDTI